MRGGGDKNFFHVKKETAEIGRLSVAMCSIVGALWLHVQVRRRGVG